jgi:nucleoside-diphosphate-sugar epimerase
VSGVLLLGGTRFLGRRVAELLLGDGFDVTVAHRGRTGSAPEAARTVRLDRESGEGLAAVRRLRPEVVVDLSAYQAAWVRAALDTLAGRPVHYVFVSSGAVYRPSPELPWPETAPMGPSPIWGAYGGEKLAAERLLQERHARGDVVATIFRFPFVMGPGNYADRESFVLSRIRAGRPLLLDGGGTAINQFVHVDDAARAIVAAAQRPDRSGGEALNCGCERVITNRGFVDLCADVLGEPALVVDIEAGALGVASAVVDLGDLVFPFPNRHYALAVSRLRERLGVEAAIGNRRMIEQYASAWLEADGPEQAPRRYAREERALAALDRTHVPRGS